VARRRCRRRVPDAGGPTLRPRLAAALADGPSRIVATSPSALRGLLALAGDEAITGRFRTTLTTCIGATTAGAARELGFEWLAEAPMQRADSLADAVAAALQMPPGGSR
jgi:uroporphyrinogen-III synthase